MSTSRFSFGDVFFAREPRRGRERLGVWAARGLEPQVQPVRQRRLDQLLGDRELHQVLVPVLDAQGPRAWARRAGRARPRSGPRAAAAATDADADAAPSAAAASSADADTQPPVPPDTAPPVPGTGRLLGPSAADVTRAADSLRLPYNNALVA